jgi:hypothetical protein
MSNLFKDESHDPTPMALDFRMFRQAPVALSYVSNRSLIMFMSIGAVTKIVTSSAYATTAVFWVLCPILITARWPLICAEDNAWSYIAFMIAMKLSLYPYLCNIRNRYVCEILSKAAVKSKERIHSGECVSSAYAMASRTVATASKSCSLAFHSVDSGVTFREE